MAEQTGIEWTDHTFNPWWGCEKVSPGCAHCYAEGVSNRYEGPGLWGAGHRFRFFGDKRWAEPFRWNRKAEREGVRRRVFCASMADVFEERDELESWRSMLWATIEQTPWLDWQILTKRPEFARKWLASTYDRDPVPYPNVWMGVSIENARHTWRADVLREIPAAVRFLSCEPLLGSLFQAPKRGRTFEPDENRLCRNCGREYGSHAGTSCFSAGSTGLPAPRVHTKFALDLTGIDWVIVGGESGPGARPMQIDWAREILEAVDERRICHGHDVALFVKQLGSRPIVTYDVDGHMCSAPLFGVRDRKGGNWDEWCKAADLRIREFPATAAVPA